MKQFILSLGLLISGVASAQIITIPDAHFKHALTSTNCVDTNGDHAPDRDADLDNNGDIDQSEALTAMGIYVPYRQISDLTGITYFSNITYLNCDGNQLTSLDISGLSNLEWVFCIQNQLIDLDVSGLTNLFGLHCNNNQLINLNVSGDINLYLLDCYYNQLTTLDLSGLTNLNQLNCSYNQLASLEVTGLINLGSIHCYHNQLTTINVSTLANLGGLYCNDNQLTSLYLKNWTTEAVHFPNNPNLIYICADSTQISTIQSQANVYGLTNCVIKSDCNVAVEPVLPTEVTNLNLFPNPAETTLYIPADVQITQADIFDTKGALVRSVSVRNNQIEIQGLASGAYFARLYSDAKLYSTKFIVK